MASSSSSSSGLQFIDKSLVTDEVAAAVVEAKVAPIQDVLNKPACSAPLFPDLPWVDGSLYEGLVSSQADYDKMPTFFDAFSDLKPRESALRFISPHPIHPAVPISIQEPPATIKLTATVESLDALNTLNEVPTLDRVFSIRVDVEAPSLEDENTLKEMCEQEWPSFWLACTVHPLGRVSGIQGRPFVRSACYYWQGMPVDQGRRVVQAALYDTCSNSAVNSLMMRCEMLSRQYDQKMRETSSRKRKAELEEELALKEKELWDKDKKKTDVSLAIKSRFAQRPICFRLMTAKIDGDFLVFEHKAGCRVFVPLKEGQHTIPCKVISSF